MPSFHEEEIREVLRKSWSIHSSTKWTSANPAKGQCGVTALVIHDLTCSEARSAKRGFQKAGTTTTRFPASEWILQIPNLPKQSAMTTFRPVARKP